MELVSKVFFQCGDPQFTLRVGESTEGLEVSEGKKQQLLADFPDWFEVIGAVEKEVPAEKPRKK